MLSLIEEVIGYAGTHTTELSQALWEHFLLVAVALTIGIGLAVPLGLLTSRSATASLAIINSFNGLRVVPSLAVLFLAIPYFGLSFTSAAIALTLLALPPILINSDAAYRSIDPAIKEAALGMGMTQWQLWRQIETPLALPVIVAGIRTATIEVIASATLAAFIGSGGLGLFVVRGFALYNIPILLVGAIPVAAITLLADISLSSLQHWLDPPQS